MNVWKKTLWAGMLCAVAAGTVFVAGCSDDIEGNEQNNPVYIQAKADKENGKYKEAAEGLISLLEQAPKSAFLHKELATLYQDNLCEYHLAIYHYERYLKLSKSLSSDDERSIRDLIAECKKEAAKLAIAEDPGLAGDVGSKTVETTGGMSEEDAEKMDVLRQDLDRYKRYKELFEKRDAELKRLQSERESGTNSGSGRTTVATTPASTTTTAVTQENTASTTTTATTTDTAVAEYDEYVVQSGDNLSKIARKTYGSSANRYLDMIRNANNLKGDNIRSGQKLKLPKLK